MKTTLDIDHELLARAKRRDRKADRPLRALVEDGLRQTLSAYTERRQYCLPDLSVGTLMAATLWSRTRGKICAT